MSKGGRGEKGRESEREKGREGGMEGEGERKKKEILVCVDLCTITVHVH